MRIGIDFDNTIACYDSAFHAAALAYGLIPADIGTDKTSVREHLRGLGRDADFTELQGYVYGPGMQHARLFPGLVDTLVAARVAGHDLFVVSHRTRVPFAGPAYELHAAARDFLTREGLVGGSAENFAPGNVWFEETRDGKLARLAGLQCDVFIDDLPEILAMPNFPAAVRAILFDPDGHYPDGIWQGRHFERHASWAAIASALRLDCA